MPKSVQQGRGAVGAIERVVRGIGGSAASQQPGLLFRVRLTELDQQVPHPERAVEPDLPSRVSRYQ